MAGCGYGPGNNKLLSFETAFSFTSLNVDAIAPAQK